MLSLVLPAMASVAIASSASPEVQVPFACGRSYVVSQAHDTGSHMKHDAWAWDFRMPEGVPIVAAMDGKVRLARGDSTIGGCDPRFAAQANYVVVTHPDGLETQYLHFSSVVVRPGDQVKAGDLLGYSGRTGWACGSHLHFKVARTQGSGWNNPSIPARIAAHGDPQTDALVIAPSCEGGRLHIADAPVPSRPLPSATALAERDRPAAANGASSAPVLAASGADAPDVQPAVQVGPDSQTASESPAVR